MAQERLKGIQACIFDAYGTLFDVNAAAQQAQDLLGEEWLPLAETWRLKQLQYTWLRSLMKRHVDFWRVTGDALDYAMGSLNLEDPSLRERLMELYLRLSPYPEVADTLDGLKRRGFKLAILSNGSPEMLSAAVKNGGLGKLLDEVLSVEEVGVFKPDTAVYQLGVTRLGRPAEEMCFVSANAWDAYAAKAFGYRVAWCNRFRQAPERIPEKPDREIPNLATLLEIL